MSTTEAPPDPSFVRARTDARDCAALEDLGDLLTRLEGAIAVEPEEAPLVLHALADQARRVRGSTLHRTMQLLDDGSREADRIVAQVRAQAAQIRRDGLRALDERVREAGRVSAGARAVMRVEAHAGDLLARLGTAGGPS